MSFAAAERLLSTPPSVSQVPFFGNHTPVLALSNRSVCEPGQRWQNHTSSNRPGVQCVISPTFPLTPLVAAPVNTGAPFTSTQITPPSDDPTNETSNHSPRRPG